jgi:hypothetical protein
MYYQVDDIPSHSATKGSVAMMMSSTTYSNGFTYINNDGGTTWLKCIHSSYGKISLTNSTSLVDFDTQPLGDWFAFNGAPAGASWVLDPDSSSEWELATENTTTDDLKYTGSTTMRAFISQTSTMRGGPSKWMSWLSGIAANFTIPPYGYNEAFASDNGSTTNISSLRMLEMPTNAYLLGGISAVSREGGGAGGASGRSYIPKHCQIVASKVDEPLIIPGVVTTGTTIIDETFESSGFTSNSWTVANDSANIWVVGQAESFSGTSSAYVSNDGGTSATYDINNAEASHFYKDFVLPSASGLTLTFDWKCQGENAAGATQYDYGAVVITDTGTTPVAGTEVITTQAGVGTNGRLGAVANLGKFNLAYGTTPGTVWNTETIDLTSYSGSTKRLVFTWKNDGSVGANPPMIVDNIKIQEGGSSGTDTLIY